MELYLSAKLYKVFDKTQRILRTATQIEEKLQNLRPNELEHKTQKSKTVLLSPLKDAQEIWVSRSCY